MTPIVQDLAVFAIVAVALGYALLKLMPRTWRSSLAATASGWAARSGFPDAVARRVEAKLASGGACGSCDSCRACATPAETAPGPQPHSTRRVIPIGRARS